MINQCAVSVLDGLVVVALVALLLELQDVVANAPYVNKPLKAVAAEGGRHSVIRSGARRAWLSWLQIRAQLLNAVDIVWLNRG